MKRFTVSRDATRWLDGVWYAAIAAIGLYALYTAVAYIATELGWSDVWHVCVLTFYTLLRVVVLMTLASVDLGADQRLGGLAAALGGGGAAAGAVPGRLSRSICCSARRSAWC